MVHLLSESLALNRRSPPHCHGFHPPPRPSNVKESPISTVNNRCQLYIDTSGSNQLPLVTGVRNSNLLFAKKNGRGGRTILQIVTQWRLLFQCFPQTLLFFGFLTPDSMTFYVFANTRGMRRDIQGKVNQNLQLTLTEENFFFYPLVV